MTPIFSLSYMFRLITVKEKAENDFSNLFLLCLEAIFCLK